MAQQQLGNLFVGRDRELQQLWTGLDDAASGRGRLFLIGGEPGIGKSRLVDELASRARDRGHAVLWGRGWEDAGAPPYWPWVQALRSYVRATDATEVRHQMGSGASDIAQMLPELRDLFGDLPPLSEKESESARFQLFDSTASFLRNAGLAAPVLVVLDDLQAADMPTILLLRFIASELARMRVTVVATYRDIALTPDHPLRAAIDELAREPGTRVMALTGLQADAVGEFIEATAGLTPQAKLVSAVWRETKGNPLFVGEAVRLLSAEGRISELADLPSLRVAVPAGVRDVIARRIGHLGDASARALTIGAALGPEFGLDVLRLVAAPETEEPLTVIDEAVAAGLLQPLTGAPGRFRFSHDLVRETLYDDVPPGRRVQLHRRIAEALEELYGRSPDAHLAELALHFFEAAQGGEPSPRGGDADVTRTRAVDYARRAGEQASRALAYEEAARLYRMALAVLDLEGTPDPESRTEILLSIGDAEARAGELSAARTAFLAAADLARRTGGARHLARAALGIGGRLPWLRVGRDTQLIPLLQDALALLGGSDDRLRVRLLARLACAWRSAPDRREQCAALTKEAVEIARRLDDPATLSYALGGRYWATWWPENPEDRLPLAQEMVALAEAAGDAERVIDAHLLLHMSYMELARLSEGRTTFEHVRRLAEDLRQPAQLWLGVAPAAEIALLAGDFGAAEALIDREYGIGPQFTPIRDETSAATMHLYRLRTEQGRLEEAESAVRSAADEFPWYPLHRAALACLLLDSDRPDEARGILAELGRDDFAALYPDNEWLLGTCMASEAAARLPEPEAAAVLYRQLQPFAGRHAIGQAEGSVGAVDRYLGLLAATVGELDAAEEHLRDAVGLNERMGARPWAAHSRTDLAALLLRRDAPGDRSTAATLLEDARQTALEIGMTALERRIDAVSAAATAGSPAAPPPPPPSAVVSFLREGDAWAIGRDRVFRLRHAKGLAYLAVLLANPGREFHVLELAGGGSGASSRTGRSGAAAVGLSPEGETAEILDAAAKAAYRDRLRELQADLDHAEAALDAERAARAQSEIDAIAAQLSAAFGLGGRGRREASAAERARQSVTKALRDALRRIRDEDVALGDHLARAVRTGLYCSYDPDPAAALTWRTERRV